MCLIMHACMCVGLYFGNKVFYFSYRVMRMRRVLGLTVSPEKAVVCRLAHIFNLLGVVFFVALASSTLLVPLNCTSV